MTNEKWIDILANIKEKFDIIEEGSEKIEDEGGVNIEFIIFKSPMGKIRLEFITKPVVLDKKVMFSNRIGSESKVEYIYSDNEYQNKLNAYKWNEKDDEWIELKDKLF